MPVQAGATPQSFGKAPSLSATKFKLVFILSLGGGPVSGERLEGAGRKDAQAYD